MRTFDMRTQLINAVTNYLQAASTSEAAAQSHLFGTGDIAKLEAKLADHFRMKHALCVSSATSGLFVLALASNLRSSEFITTGCSYGGSVASWLLLNNIPSFADIDPMTLEMRPREIRAALNKNTKAILTVDTFGIPCDSESVRQIADENGIWYFADCSQSFGATRKNRPTNYLADAIVVSLTVGKPISAGEGGAILTNNTELYEKLIWFSQHPNRQKKNLGFFISNEFAFNARIHPLAATWANAVFETSLSDLSDHQASCFKIIEALNRIGLTESIDFETDQINPAFFRLSSAWKKDPEPEILLSQLESRGFKMKLGSNPVEVIYKQPAFVAQYPEIASRARACPEAENQVRLRFIINTTTI